MKCRWRNPIERSCWIAFLRDWWHRLWCADCRAVERLLAQGVWQLRTEPVPADGLARTLAVLELPMTRPTYHKPSWFTTRRMMLATGTLAIGLLLLLPFVPIGRKRSVDALLAQVVEAMSKVKTIHASGVFYGCGHDEPKPIKFWLKMPDKFRWEDSGGNFSVINGNKCWEGNRSATLHSLVGYLVFSHPSFGSIAVRNFRLPEFIEWTSATAYLDNLMDRLDRWSKGNVNMTEREEQTPDGRTVKVLEIVWGPTWGVKEIIAFDAETNRLVKVEKHFARDGEFQPHMVLNKFEYDLELPDDLFLPPEPCPPDCFICNAVPVEGTVEEWQQFFDWLAELGAFGD